MDAGTWHSPVRPGGPRQKPNEGTKTPGRRREPTLGARNRKAPQSPQFRGTAYFAPPGEKDFKPEITATSDRNEGDDQGNATDIQSHGQRGGGAPEVFGYPIEVGAAQQAGPPSSGTITCGCSSIIDVGAFHGAGGGSGSGTLAASYVRTYLVDMGGGLLRRRQHV